MLKKLFTLLVIFGLPFVVLLSQDTGAQQAETTPPPTSCAEFLQVKTPADLQALRNCTRQLRQGVLLKRQADLVQFRIDSSQRLVEQIQSASKPVSALNTPASQKTPASKDTKN